MTAHRRMMMFAPIVAALSLFAVPAMAGEDGRVNRSADPAKATESSRASETILLGYQLADYARAGKDARAMIVAARMVGSVEVTPGTDKGRLSGNAPAKPDPDAPDAVALFAEARDLAAGDPEILQAVEAAQAEATRGIACRCGAVRTVQYIPGKTTWTVGFVAQGQEPKLIGVRRDSATPVTLRIHDENGNLVCQDLSGNVTLYCRVNPIWTGRFSAAIANLGDRGTGVAMVTN